MRKGTKKYFFLSLPNMGNRPFGPEFPESLKNSGVGGFIDLGKLKNKKKLFFGPCLIQSLD